MASLKIKKGQKANLPSSKQEDTLYICEEGNLFYDFAANKRIELGELKNNNNNNLVIGDEPFVNGKGNIGKNTSIINGFNNNGIIQFPVSSIELKPYMPAPNARLYNNSNVLHITFTDSYTPEQTRPESWDILKNYCLTTFHDTIEEFDENKATFSELLPDIAYPIILSLDGIYFDFSGFTLIATNVREYTTHGEFAELIRTNLECSFLLVSLHDFFWQRGTFLMNQIKDLNSEAFIVQTADIAPGDSTQIIKSLYVKPEHEMFMNFGWQFNLSNGTFINGDLNINLGSYNLISGLGLHNKNAYSTILGKYNKPNEDYIFSIGNGNTNASRKNIFGITWDGRVNTVGTYATNGADYAEYFEWKEIPKVKDIRGLFVTLDNNKIRLASKKDSYILGIISSNPGLIGNDSVEEWSYKYKTDIFGNKILDKDGKEIISKKYDNTKKYVSRSERKEWATVGLLGQIVVVDDGTCKPGKYCYPGKKGIATAAKKGYYVMERLDDNHIKVLFK